MTQSLKERTITGMIWSAVQRFGTMIISFVANLVLARLLSPEDFGVIGMLMVFIALADTLINGGFASALIQKKEPTQQDYSTVFYWNLSASAVLYVALYFSAPAIAAFYSMPLLNTVLRVQGLVLLFNAFNIIQNNQLIKQLNFKRLAKVNIIATSVGAVVGISMAFAGFGVWSLVAKMLIISIATSIILWYGSTWRPHKQFSWQSFRSLFRFGSFMLISSISDTLYKNIQALIIGRFFSATDLGYYTQAKKLNDIPTISMSAIIDQVTFPVFSLLQENLIELKNVAIKNLKAISFIVFPLMVVLIINAEPLIILLFTSKWAASIPFFQILCIYGMLYPINSMNTNIVKSLGKGKLYFYTSLIKRFIGLIAIIGGLQFGLLGMMWGIVASGLIFFFINAFISNNIINYGLLEQFRDMMYNFLISTIAGLIVYVLFASNLQLNYFTKFLIQTIFYFISYLSISYITRNESGIIILKIIKTIISNRYSK